MTRPRGFTLLETLLALALIGVLAMTSMSWTTSTLRLRASSLRSDDRSRAIADLERALRIDLLNHDQTTPARLRREERVWIADGQLHVLTREAGDVRVTYAVRDGVLTRTIARLDGEVVRANAMLGSLDAASFTVRTAEGDPWAEIVVTVRDGLGESVVRLDVPREWVR